MTEQWVVHASRESHDCVNPVRSCEEIYFADVLEQRDKSKELIRLSIGLSFQHHVYNNCIRLVLFLE